MSSPTIRIAGLGGVFFRARDPAALAKWYEEHFGITQANEHGVWIQQAGPTVFAPFEEATDYFGPAGKAFMFNFRVSDLEGTLSALAEQGIVEVKHREVMDGIGSFGWVADPEGNRIELWEPAKRALQG